MFTFTNVAIGVWNIFYQMQIGTPGTDTCVTSALLAFVGPGLAPTNTPTTMARTGFATPTSFQAENYVYLTGSVTVSNTVVQNYAVNAYISKSSGTATTMTIVGSTTNPTSYAIITRIA